MIAGWLQHHTVVVVATIWPEIYRAYLAIGSPQNDTYRQHREVCELASLIQVPSQLTADEQESAVNLATSDLRLAAALRVRDYGLIQTLAAAPALIDRWEMAGPFGQAVIVAAVDARRVGILGPLPADYLHAASPSYIPAEQRRHRPPRFGHQGDGVLLPTLARSNFRTSSCSRDRLG